MILPARVFPRPLAFNVIPHIGPFAEGGFTGEEWKIAHESRKILAHDTLKVVATCVRVPVRRAHAEAVYVETREPLDRAEVLRALTAFPGIVVQDEPEATIYPDPLQAEGRVDVLVGRCAVRSGCGRGLSFLGGGGSASERGGIQCPADRGAAICGPDLNVDFFVWASAIATTALRQEGLCATADGCGRTSSFRPAVSVI